MSFKYKGPAAVHESQVAEQRTGVLVCQGLADAAVAANSIPDAGVRGRVMYALEAAHAFLHGQNPPDPAPGLFSGEVSDADTGEQHSGQEASRVEEA